MAADVVRLVIAGLALVLATVCASAAVVAPTWDQRGRFAVVIGYSTIIVGGQLDTLGQPATWRTWALAVITVLAVISTATFLIRHVRHTRGGPDDGRSAVDQRDLFRSGPPPRGAGDAGHREGPPSGGTEA